MGGLFGEKTRTVFEERDIGRAPFSFKDPFEALVSPQTAQERLTDVPESGPGPEPITVGKQVTAPAPGNALLRGLATFMAIGGKTGLASLLQRKQDASFDEAEQSATRRTEQARKSFEKRQAEQPQFTFDKANDRITVVNPRALKSGNFKDAVKFISLRDPKATISGVQESLGITLTEAEQKGLSKILESGDEVLFRQTVEKIGKRAAQEGKQKEFQEQLGPALEALDAIQQEKPFSASEKAQGELAMQEALRTLTVKPILDHAKDIRNERRSDTRTLQVQGKLEERQAKREAATEERAVKREESAANRARVQTEITSIRSKLTDLRSRLRTVDSEMRFSKSETLVQEKSQLEAAVAAQEADLKTKTTELGGTQKSLPKAAPKVKVGDIVEHQGKRKKVVRVNDNGTVVLEPVK